ncbi:MAG TPA: shikimate dehydrogenase [Steroidobacteraceae bacterium]|jgi:shikimate dehydrogenase|nr:shikimate dehydrogenase [Steroidobacteraceae bacterium]
MVRSGLIGRDILASRSPWLHEQEARALGFDLKYELFDFKARGLGEEALGPMLRRLSDEGFSGVNVTFPFKASVMPLLDSIDDRALLVGAVNTVAMREGRLVGYNTDMSGFRDSFARDLPGASLSRVLLLGAGGAGAAVACALLSLGTERLEIADVQPDRAEALARRLRRRFRQTVVVAPGLDSIDPRGLSGVVNATPIGMASHPGSAFDVGKLLPQMWVVDVIYFPLETQLLRAAREVGCRTLNGSGMVIGQAALAFEIITGRVPDQRRMSQSFHEMPAAPADT